MYKDKFPRGKRSVEEKKHELEGENMKGAWLAGADLKGAYMSKTILERADLKGTYLKK